MERAPPRSTVFLPPLSTFDKGHLLELATIFSLQGDIQKKTKSQLLDLLYDLDRALVDQDTSSCSSTAPKELLSMALCCRIWSADESEIFASCCMISSLS